MEILPNGGQSLGSIGVGARGYPDGLEAWVVDHCPVVLIDYNALIFVLVACLAQVGRLSTADGNHICMEDTVEKCADKALVHASEASDGGINFGVPHGSGRTLGSNVSFGGAVY